MILRGLGDVRRFLACFFRQLSHGRFNSFVSKDTTCDTKYNFTARWKSINLIARIYESGDKSNVTNYRWIFLLNVTFKQFDNLAAEKLSRIAKRCQRASGSYLLDLFSNYTYRPRVCWHERVDVLFANFHKASLTRLIVTSR